MSQEVRYMILGKKELESGNCGHHFMSTKENLLVDFAAVSKSGHIQLKFQGRISNPDTISSW